MSISRRGFIGAAASFAGLAIVPSWGQFQQQRREIDLSQFCDEYYGAVRYDLSTPFAQGGHAIGTDGRVLVRTTLAALPEVDADRRLPNIDKILIWQHKPDKWLKWPRELYVGTKNRFGGQCPFCNGKGGTGNVRMCGMCSGEGYASIINDPDEFNSYEAPCKACLRTGHLWDVKCSHCDGSGETKTACYQPVGKVIVASHYDAQLRKLGDLEFCVVGENCNWEALRFRGDGFDGLLMGMNVDREEIDWRRGVLA